MHRSDASLSGRPAWLGQRERGSELAVRLMMWITFALGRRVARLLIYPIALYFAAVSARARRASREYLRRVLGRRAGFTHVMRHFHAFGATLHDRLYFARGRVGEFDIALEQPDEVRRWLDAERGCILVGSHLGSFEVLRALAAAHARPVNALMYIDLAAQTSRVLRSIDLHASLNVIPFGQPQSLLRVEECLARGEMVGILADRVWRNERAVRCDFLGSPAPFPVGPWRLAGLLGAPVILFFGLYRGERRYEIRLEPFAQCIELERRAREASVKRWIERYAARLEAQCRLAPYNWFNFYDYWR
jgi:predicted LPLAT superfamily acyltransferase